MSEVLDAVEVVQPNVIESLSKVMKDVGAVRKQERNKQQNFNFRGIDTVTNAVFPALTRHSVVVVPNLVAKSMEESRTKSGAIMHNVYVTVEYTFYGPCGDSITAKVAAESFDSGDKATAKAMSVALRTALLQSLMLPTDDVDPDAESYERAPIPPATQEQLALAHEAVEFLQWTPEMTIKAVAYAAHNRVTVIDQMNTDEARRFLEFAQKKIDEAEAKATEAQESEVAQ